MPVTRTPPSLRAVEMSFAHWSTRRPKNESLLRRRFAIRNAVCLTMLLALPCVALAQDDTSQSDVNRCGCTVNAGGGWVPRLGIDDQGLHGGWNFQGGFGLQMPPLTGHRWSWFIDATFSYEQAGVTESALKSATILNPTNVGLVEATSGQAKFYSTTFDPTFRLPVRSRRVQVYLFGGIGWFKRSLEFTEPSGQGSLLQPGNATVFGKGGDSAAYDGGGGVNIRLSRGRASWMFYMEARALHGLAINTTTWLVPISAGLRW